MGARGPLGKSVTELKLHGGFRPDRHADRPQKPDGAPTMPPSLKGTAAKHWEELVPRLIKLGHVGAIDSPMIALACEVYSLLMKALRDLKRSKPSRGAQANFDRHARQYGEITKKLGVSPLDRSRLKPETATETKPSTVTGFARKRG
jgi:phage terminase small subunit